ncbi:hypothetical protein J2766_004792 [Agrobacterium tumefaciens]|uniref:PD-(D/E)XK motif protein n=1 Tax=Agrobacterium tumefaciens TaxID=358 RepID=A0AAW8M1K4_AGRTU|nr:PD-(D/E)XK motif protein [Agrobacterium tumefaciens]MBP2568181.1 hypothetical protein [Agrobacterium tumefaciens]MDR6705141.1 hypothetical protein [Agrobacterium tumefaciens]
MSEASPWDQITVPTEDYNVLRLAARMAVPCFWARDVAGHCLFIMELDGDHSLEFRKNQVPVKGLEVDLRTEKGGQRLVLTLEKQADRDLFEALCRTLARALENASNAASSLAIALSHLRRWKTFMSGRSQHLSAEDVRGLFAELTFLIELIGVMGASHGIDAWKGPEKSHQDFIHGNTAVEIKSLSGTERSTVRISSEDQLESLNDNLFLRIYRLSGLPDSSAARSLNALVEAVHDLLDSAEAVESFDAKLSSHGYAPLPEYDDLLFVVSEIRTYRVEDGFPKLVRSEMPEAVGRVSYDIRLESIESYLCNSESVFGGG